MDMVDLSVDACKHLANKLYNSIDILMAIIWICTHFSTKLHEIVQENMTNWNYIQLEIQFHICKTDEEREKEKAQIVLPLEKWHFFRYDISMPVL